MDHSIKTSHERLCVNIQLCSTRKQKAINKNCVFILSNENQTSCYVFSGNVPRLAGETYFELLHLPDMHRSSLDGDCSERVLRPPSSYRVLTSKSQGEGLFADVVEMYL